MSILLFIVFGFVAGLIARAIMPGRQSMGLLKTALLGMVGSFVGGFFGSLMIGQSIFVFQTAGLIGSVIGALIVLAVMGLTGRSRATV